jgi:hypothetical protein
MSKLHGKQIKQSSIALNKLTGGEVSFDSTAEMNFLTGARLFYIDAPTVDTELVNKKYVDDQVFQASEGAVYTAGAGLVLTNSTFSLDPTSAGAGLAYTTGVYSVNVDSDALEVSSDTVTLKNTIIGNRTFSNNLIVDGDFTVNGTTTFVNTTQLEITDSIITLAKGNSAESGVDAGIEIDRGTNPLANLIWDESASVWVAGIDGSELALLTNVGTGLSRNNNVVSLDTTQVASDLAGLGLTDNGSKIDVVPNEGIIANASGVSINPLAAGVGLSFTTGVFTVNASGGLVISGDDVTLASSAAGDGLTLSNGVFNVGASGGLVVDGTNVSIASSAAGNGLTLNSGVLSVGANNGLTVNGTSVSIASSAAGSGLNFTTGVFAVNASGGLDISGDNVVIASSAAGNGLTLNSGVFAVNASGGLSISGDNVVIASSVAGAGLALNAGVLNVNVGVGIEILSDAIAVDLATNPGLAFDGNGLKANIDNSTLIINGSGQIEVDNSFLNATPVYDLTTLATSYTSNDSVTTIALSDTPSDFSRVSVLVNGQKQKVADGSNSLDAYFVASGATGVPLALDNLNSGDLLVWNAGNAGFSLESGDDVEIIYEA